MKKFISILIIACIILLPSCQRKTIEDDNTLKIVCTIFPYYDICSQIVGSDADVFLLNNSGTDLHNYEPTLRDIKLISECDIFIYGGGMSDSWVINTVKASQNTDIKMIRLMDFVVTYEEEFKEGMQNESHDHDHDHDDSEDSHVNEIDEHIWLSLANAQSIADVICEVVSSLNVANSLKYIKNLESFNFEAQRIDDMYKELFAQGEYPLVFADRFAFRYFTESYDLSYYAAFPGCSTESFASFNTIAYLLKVVDQHNLDCILTIDTPNSQVAKTISQEMNCKILTLNSCQSVSQRDIDSGITYLKIMESNYLILMEAIL